MAQDEHVACHVVDARYLGDYKVWLEFNDGRKGVVDLADELYGDEFEALVVEGSHDHRLQHADLSNGLRQIVERRLVEAQAWLIGVWDNRVQGHVDEQLADFHRRATRRRLGRAQCVEPFTESAESRHD